ncbi:beta-propeller fold lactonase family protein [Tumebacillus permanentifrigoris]|uniref:YVTN family beta-propeller protein n=1 Tax=Tumebacillus permanentifrigoris TaxID=378543 RepID=A0A316D6M3_9BACL|nr:beta-propeller fold lactonase family protein [Tumebacillus permanentifrigoris]PWK07428.1 YVTN family beta-propeller protein [Tumebacillus permanentifrigoris]
MIKTRNKYLLTAALALLVIGGGTLYATSQQSAAPVDSTVRSTSTHSGSVVLSADGRYAYTSNVDVDTVTIVDTEKNKKLAEIEVGKEPRNLALSPNGKYLYVSAMYDNEVDVIDLNKKKVSQKIPVGVEPAGLLSDLDGSHLYVANYRSKSVSVLDVTAGKVAKEIQVHDNPYALALTADGHKLYVTHYLDGLISVVDTKKQAVSKEITLHDSPEPANHDQKVSQGTPEELESITIDPSGKVAWVAHNLYNTDTHIQFESSIFPTISVLDVQTDQELPDQRKELFKAMNIRDSQNKTQIVSNPTGVEFLPNGEKAYVLFAGSEDILVFDTRRGGNAVQLVRRVPGDNPRGMAITPDGSTIYVHNAMSHDLAKLTTGGSDAYAQAQMSPDALKLIAKDSLPEQVRLGKQIFYSANSDKYATDITGQNWMSCASCHALGYQDKNVWITDKGLRRTPSNAGLKDSGLMMWDGTRDDMGDYILTVQGEMGGMSKLDPSQPLPPEVQKMFDALDAYIKYDRQIPVPQSPYRNADGTMTTAAQNGQHVFQTAGCATCHAGSGYTDSNLALGSDGKLTITNTTKLHDVVTANAKDVGTAGDARGNMQNSRTPQQFDTPTLLGIYSRAPYFHDGSAKTLEEVFSHPGTHHDKTQNLSESDFKDLVEFLKELQ